MKVEGKVAIVTGGAQGLGRAFGEALLRGGAKVCICDVNIKQGEVTLKNWQETFGSDRCMFLKCDVSEHDEFDAVFQKVKQQYGMVDVLVNNAGVGYDETSDKWRKTISINLIGVIEGSKLAEKYMQIEKGGRGGVVVNIASTAGLTPIYYMPVYTASKYGVVGYTRSVAAKPERERSGIRFTCLCPAFTDTSMLSTGFTYPQVSGDDNVTKLITSTGINSIEDVVKAFMLLVETDNNNGGVMTVTKKRGIEYRHGKPHKL